MKEFISNSARYIAPQSYTPGQGNIVGVKTKYKSPVMRGFITLVHGTEINDPVWGVKSLDGLEIGFNLVEYNCPSINELIQFLLEHDWEVTLLENTTEFATWLIT